MFGKRIKQRCFIQLPFIQLSKTKNGPSPKEVPFLELLAGLEPATC